MKIKYECDHCKAQFDTEAACRSHEILHLHGIEELKYYVQYATKDNLCSYCDNGYYVYGCEFNCDHLHCNPSNNYKEFQGERINDFKRSICQCNGET